MTTTAGSTDPTPAAVAAPGVERNASPYLYGHGSTQSRTYWTLDSTGTPKSPISSNATSPSSSASQTLWPSPRAPRRSTSRYVSLGLGTVMR